MCCSFFVVVLLLFFFFKQKTAYEMRISDWSSDVCSSDLDAAGHDLERRLSQWRAAGSCLRRHAGGAAPLACERSQAVCVLVRFSRCEKTDFWAHRVR